MHCLMRQVGQRQARAGKTAAPAPLVEPPKPAGDAQLQAGKAAEGRYLVHLGVYTAEGNAKDLLAALKKSGFAAFRTG